MGANSSDRLSTGQPYPIPRAAAWNSMIDAAQWVERNRSTGGFASQDLTTNRKNLLMRMTSDADVAAFAVVGFGEPATTPQVTDADTAIQNGVILKRADPKAGKWAIALDSIPSGGTVGTCIVRGLTWAECNIKDEADTHVDYDDTANELITKTGGIAEIMWKPTGTGKQWCLLLIGGVSSDVCSVIQNYPVGTVETESKFVIVTPDGTKTNPDGSQKMKCELVADTAAACICALKELAKRQQETIDDLTTRIEDLENA